MLRGLAVTLAVWALGFAVLRLTIAGPELCEPPPPTAVEASISAAATWLSAHQSADGRFLYEYDRDARAASPEYNEVRHAGVTMSLYQLAAAGKPDYLDTAERGLDRMLGRLLRRDGWAAIREDDGTAKLGSTALLVAALVFRREATGDLRYDPLLAELGRFLLAMQEPNGRMLAYWSPALGGPIPDLTSRYYTGEAFWALTLLARTFPHEREWLDGARRVARYLAEERDEAEELEFAPWPDQWAAYGFAELARLAPLSESEVAYLRSLAERFGMLVRFDAQRGEDDVSTLFRGEGARGAGLGTWVEGLGALWRAASVETRLADLRPAISERALCGAGLLVARQTAAEEAEGDARAVGAWFRSGVTRMDDQQHALSALLAVLEILTEAEPQE
ncbi:hypothetical protein HRbin29_01360 [bacterium HR29]|nr:hypothetical protein HRbin29_01360 [bacterium HR29]